MGVGREGVECVHSTAVLAIRPSSNTGSGKCRSCCGGAGDSSSGLTAGVEAGDGGGLGKWGSSEDREARCGPDSALRVESVDVPFIKKETHPGQDLLHGFLGDMSNGYRGFKDQISL